MIHPSALIHPKAEVDSSVEIGPWCTVGPNVKISRGTRLISHVVIDGWTEIGEDNIVFPFAVLGAVPQDLKYKGEPTRLLVGNRNTIREGVTLNLGTVQGGNVTQIGNQNLLMAYVHLGHDCIVGNNCILANGCGLAGHAVLGNYVTVGGMSGVSQFVRLGDHAYIGGLSGIEKDIPPYSIAVGSRPCELRSANIVGLRRRGFAAETISKINEAIKLWARADVPKDDCLAEIEAKLGSVAEVQNFVKFIRESESGVVR